MDNLQAQVHTQVGVVMLSHEYHVIDKHWPTYIVNMGDHNFDDFGLSRHVRQ